MKRYYFSMTRDFIVSEEHAGSRLDVACVARFPHLSRALLQKLIKSGAVTVNLRTVKVHYSVRAGDHVVITLPAALAEAPLDTTLPALSFLILFEDREIVVIDKPPGVAMYAGEGREQGTVAEWFATRYPASNSVGNTGRPGIVHRLDKETSGVVILAKTQEVFEYLQRQFQQRRVKKEYIALVFGVPGMSEGRIVRPVARSKRYPLRRTIHASGKMAITEWRREEVFGKKYALLRLFPFTGRMHQLRVHLHFLGYPIVGDRLYTYKRQRPPQGVRRQLLHAELLRIRLLSGKEVTFKAPLPKDFQDVIDNLRHDVR
jgi:23S rRNA pseudouridine1911/1915/1917 synthase